jgi:hypothetical protein
MCGQLRKGIRHFPEVLRRSALRIGNGPHLKIFKQGEQANQKMKHIYKVGTAALWVRMHISKKLNNWAILATE